MASYAITRIWDDGGEWYDTPRDEFETRALARAAAEAHIDDNIDSGDYGQDEGITDVRVSYEIESDDGDSGIYRYTATLAVDEDALIAEAGGDPDCAHEWTGKGGCTQNPGVWSTGGTSFLFREHCAHCGIVKETVSHGLQRNPDESDTVRYFRREEE